MKRRFDSGRGVVGGLALAAAAGAGLLQAGTESTPPAPVKAAVAYSVSGSDGAGNAAAAAYFASRLNARPFWSAVNADSLPAAAVDPSPGGPSGQFLRVNLVQVNFANWHDWLALVFDGPGNALTYSARRPAKRHLHEGFFGGNESVLPGREQIDRNAVIELAGDFYQDMATRTVPEPRPLLRVRVSKTVEEAGRGQDADFFAAAQRGLTKTPSKAELEGIRALAMAALCRAGWWPTTNEAPQSLDLAVDCQPDRYAVRARFTPSKGKQERATCDLYPASLHAGLVRLFNGLMPTRTPGVDFAAVDLYPVCPVGTHENVLLVEQGDTLLAFDMMTGQKKWALSPPKKKQVRFTFRTSVELGGLVFVNNPALQVLDLTDGRDGSMQAFAGPTYPWGVDASEARWVKVKARGAGHASHRNNDINATGWLMVASGRRLIAYEKGVARWEYAGLSALTAGPCRLDDRVIVGGRAGHVTALRNPDGQVLWTTDLGERLAGPVVSFGAVVVVASLEGTLFGVNAADGRLVWKRDLGDTAIAGPFATAKGVFLASGASRLWLVNPDDGQVTAGREWPASLLAAAPLVNRDGFACSDSRGVVAFLDPSTLRTLRQVILNVPLTAGILPVGKLPRRWGAQNDPGASAPGVIVGDENGFVHLVAADEHEELSTDELGL